MSFLYPHVLFFLLVPVLLAAAGIWAHYHTRRSWQLLVAPAHREQLVRQRPLWRTIVPATAGLLALTFTILAAARPINGFEEAGAITSGRNLIIAVDVSRSMETTDVSPSRLEEARSAAYELIDALPTDKIGLMVFSGEADLVVPLTYDHAALKETLQNIGRDWIAAGGTNFGRVLQRAIKDFERSAPDGTNALVILSDGEDTMDTSDALAKEARSKNLLVITVGIGTTAGGAIPDPKGTNGLWQDANGKHVISKLDMARLSQFAKATGGDFFAMNSGTDLAAFARQAAEKLDRHEENFSAAKVPNDLYTWFALPALILALVAILLGTEWRRSARLALWVLVLHAATTQSLQAATAECAQAYSNGLALKAEGKTDKANEELSQALLDNDTALQTAALHALGNLSATRTFDKLRALYQAPTEMPGSDEEEPEQAPAPSAPSPEQLQKIVDELKQNITPFQDALNIDASFAPAQKNIDKINTLIKKLEEEIERLKQQQQQQQDKQDQQQQDKQDQQQKDKQDQQQQDKQDQQQQDKQDQQQQDKQDQQQDKQDQQQDKQDQQQQDKQDQQQDKQDQQQQDKQDQQQQDKQDQQQQDKQQQAQANPADDKEKAEQKAASILKMHMDEEKGSPIPQQYPAVRPAKDY